MAPYIICVDGLIGAGKTSLMQRLSKNYTCFPEPHSEWSLLPQLYCNRELFGFPFHLQVLISRFKEQFQFPEGLVLVERCPWTSQHIFAPLILNERQMMLYNQVHEELKPYNVDYFIYLEIDPAKAFRRISQRSPIDRQISEEYLFLLHEKYTCELKQGLPNVTVIDASRSLDRVEQDVIKNISLIFPNV